MKVVYSPKLQAKKNLYALAQHGTKRLEEVLGPSAGLVSAEWERFDDHRGRDSLVLEIADFSGQRSAHFTPEELEDPVHLDIRLHRLWGDLLQARSHQQIQELMGSGQGSGDG